MSDQNQPIIQSWPGGHKTICGGTRTGVKLSRPWQGHIRIDPGTCPFCTGKGKVIEELPNGWLLLENRFTPYPFHRMVIPANCWGEDTLHELGGLARIEDAFRCLFGEIRKHSGLKLFVNIHIGALAGQNVGHLHNHIVAYMLDDDSVTTVPEVMFGIFEKNPNLVLSEDTNFLVGVGGIRAGQCFILPLPGAADEALAGAIHWVVSLYNEKFKSEQGLPPDYGISLMFQGGVFQYGLYTPILNQWGAAEWLVQYEQNPIVTLPWSHEETVEHLLS